MSNQGVPLKKVKSDLKISDNSSSRGKIISFIKKNISFSAFILLLLLFAILQGGRFLNFDNVLTILNQTVVVAVVSFGLTFVILEGGIDLSVGSVLGLAGVITASVLHITSCDLKNSRHLTFKN